MGQDAERLKELFDMREVVAKDLPLIRHDAKHDTFSCPFHNEKTPGGFRVFADGYHCFSCHKSGDIFDWYSDYHGMEFLETLAMLNGGEVPESEVDPVVAAQQAAERAEREAKRLEETIQSAQEALDSLRKAQKWLDYHQQLDPISRDLWRQRGISDDFWIDEWKLGYNPEYKVWQNHDGNWQIAHKSPTLTIPVWGHGWEVNNIKHRLLIPGDYPKYTQEQRGVKAQSFVANPDLKSGPAIVVEGEIKAMNTFITYDSDSMQVIGLPSATPDEFAIQEILNHDPLYLIMDPDTYNRRQDGKIPVVLLADLLGRERVRHLRLTDKIDDMIIQYGLDKTWLRSVMAQARPFN